MIEVRLNESDLLLAQRCGIERAVSYMPQYQGITVKKNWDLEVNGGSFEVFTDKQIDAVAAEIAAAHYLGYLDYMPTNTTFKDKADIGDNVEVKHTRGKHNNLLISAIDRDDDIAILVTGVRPDFTIIGWAYVAECKDEAYRSSLIKGNAYLIPRDKLKPMDSLAMRGDKAYERIYSF